jgi:hypothetical protein
MKRYWHRRLLSYFFLVISCVCVVSACSRSKRKAAPTKVEPTQPPPASNVQLGEPPRLTEDSK